MSRVKFQSTRPRRGAIWFVMVTSMIVGCFNPRAPGGARSFVGAYQRTGFRFQSTRPRRGAMPPPPPW